MTDRRRGSVLMEFIVTLPIYIFFFGALFSLGEMLLRPIWLQSADRTAAFDVQNAAANGWKFVVEKLFPVDSVGVDGGLQDKLDKKSSAYYADTSVAGPFSLRAAAQANDKYQMAPWTHGWVGFPTWSDGLLNAKPVDGELGRLLGRQRVEILGKERTDSRTYGFYVLKRVKYSRSEKNWRHNDRPPSDLVNARPGAAHWNLDVFAENWHDTVTDTSNGKRNPSSPGGFHDYSRYGQYKTWSR